MHYKAVRVCIGEVFAKGGLGALLFAKRAVPCPIRTLHHFLHVEYLIVSDERRLESFSLSTAHMGVQSPATCSTCTLVSAVFHFKHSVSDRSAFQTSKINHRMNQKEGIDKPCRLGSLLRAQRRSS